jgi:hypothetical protein
LLWVPGYDGITLMMLGTTKGAACQHAWVSPRMWRYDALSIGLGRALDASRRQCPALRAKAGELSNNEFMLRLVVANVVVAIAAIAVTWAMSNPDDSAGTLVDDVVSLVATYGSPILGWPWAVAIGLFAAGAVLQILSIAPPHSNATWQWGLSMPSRPTSLMGIDSALGLTAIAVGVGYRWLSGIRHRWTLMAKLCRDSRHCRP